MRPSSAPLRQFTEQLGHLVDVSCIIDRNGDDSEFAHNGKEIVYIFDTNVVQMFLEPYKNPHFCEVFHTRLWDGDREADLDVNAQACLIAAEYLLSGKLPGQKGGIWYMTRGHKAELDAQERYLRGHIADNVARMRGEPQFRQEVFDNIARLTEVLDVDPAAGRAALEARAASAKRRVPWLNELRALSDKEFRQRAPGIRSREVCRLLARDDVAEPANQLFRYRSGEIAGRFKNLETMLAPTTGEEREIEDEVARWRGVLADVLSRHPANLKTREGFRADCQALGLISWAGRQSKYRDRRFVMVTGDAIILEAFRWRNMQRQQPTPHFIRPINHFSPLFNPVSARSTLSSQQYAFLKLRQVLEFLLISINLHLLVDAELDARLQAREAFVQVVQRRIEVAIGVVADAFPQSGDAIWLRRKTRELERLISELRPIERLMLEAFPNLVAPRLKQERLRFEEAVGNGGEALLGAIEKQLRAASEIGAQFWLQTAPDTIVRLLEVFRSRKEVAERRATVHMYLNFGENHLDLGYDTTFARLQRLGRAELLAELEPLKVRPAKLFALAALLAFRIENWREAARYSHLAATASLEQTKYIERLDEAPPEHYEYNYLMAAALRFRLASFEPSIGSAYADPWGEWLHTADDVLVECIRYHRAKNQLTRTMRAQCERAAIHVSYCEWFAFGQLNDRSFYTDPDARALASYRIVVDELRRCEDLLQAAEEHAVVADADKAVAISQFVLGSVREHYRANVYAAVMTARRLREIWPHLEDTIDALVAVLPEPHADRDWSDGPLIALAYVAAVRGNAEVLDAMEDRLSLPLDKAVLAGLRRLNADRGA